MQYRCASIVNFLSIQFTEYYIDLLMCVVSVCDGCCIFASDPPQTATSGEGNGTSSAQTTVPETSQRRRHLPGRASRVRSYSECKPPQLDEVFSMNTPHSVSGECLNKYAQDVHLDGRNHEPDEDGFQMILRERTNSDPKQELREIAVRNSLRKLMHKRGISLDETQSKEVIMSALMLFSGRVI